MVVSTRRWKGEVTIENLDDVFEAIVRFLTIDGEARYYSFLSFVDGELKELYTSLQVRPEIRGNGLCLYRHYYRISRAAKKHGPIDTGGPRDAEFGRIIIADTHGSRSFDTGAIVSFTEKGRLTIKHTVKTTEEEVHFLWVFAPERHEFEPVWDDGGGIDMMKEKNA